MLRANAHLRRDETAPKMGHPARMPVENRMAAATVSQRLGVAVRLTLLCRGFGIVVLPLPLLKCSKYSNKIL